MRIFHSILTGILIPSLHLSLCTGSIFLTAVALTSNVATAKEPEHFCAILHSQDGKYDHHNNEEKQECEGTQTCLLPSHHQHINRSHGESRYIDLLLPKQNVPFEWEESSEISNGILARAGPFFEKTKEHVHCLEKRE